MPFGRHHLLFIFIQIRFSVVQPKLKSTMKSNNNVILDVRAVDIGQISTKFITGRNPNGNSNHHLIASFPSFACRLSSGLIRTGNTDGCVVNVKGEHFYVGKDAMRHRTDNEPHVNLVDNCHTSTYAALLLGALHYIAEAADATCDLEIGMLVLGLPVNSSNENLKMLRHAVVGEHLLPKPCTPGANRRVTIHEVTVVAEPQGAHLSNKLQNRGNGDGLCCIVDAGGGTLNWLVSRGAQPYWNRSGSHPECMIACASSVAHRINPFWSHDSEILQRIDMAISKNSPTFKIGNCFYDLAPFESDIANVLIESSKQLVDAVGCLDGLDHVFFTGGGANLHFDFFRNQYPENANIMEIDTEPMFANVRGFQLAGERLLTFGSRNIRLENEFEREQLSFSQLN